MRSSPLLRIASFQVLAAQNAPARQRKRGGRTPAPSSANYKNFHRGRPCWPFPLSSPVLQRFIIHADSSPGRSLVVYFASVEQSFIPLSTLHPILTLLNSLHLVGHLPPYNLFTYNTAAMISYIFYAIALTVVLAFVVSASRAAKTCSPLEVDASNPAPASNVVELTSPALRLCCESPSPSLTLCLHCPLMTR